MDLYLPLKSVHNIVGMILLFVLLIAIVAVGIRYLQKKPFDKTTRLFALIGLIVTHLQIFFGVILYFLSPVGLNNFTGPSMKNDFARFYIVEHPIGMILAAVLITIGYQAGKNVKHSNKGKYNRTLIYYILGFGIIYYLIPWFLWN